MKKIVAFVLVMIMLGSMVVFAEGSAQNDGNSESAPVFAHPFLDADGHWAELDIIRAYSSGMINGDPDGNFRPDDPISRAEFIKMTAALFCERGNVSIPETMDDGSHWAAKYYNFASSQMYRPLTENYAVDGIVPGKMSVDDFDKPISRWEMAYIMGETLRYLGVVEYPIGEKAYSDAEKVAQTYSPIVVNAINNCYMWGIMKGDESGNINGDKGGTRAEAVVIMNRVDDYYLQILAWAEEQQKQWDEYVKKLEESQKVYEVIPQGHPVVTVEMSDGGKFKIELYPEYAPQTVANFVALVQEGFYDGLTFHRVVEGFMAQGGDPKGDGSGDLEYHIKGEFAANGFTENTLSHTKGVISMARANHPDSAASQFFICFDDASYLDGNYAAFGKVTEGMDVVEKFLDVERTLNEMGEIAKPVEPLVMKKVTVELDGKTK